MRIGLVCYAYPPQRGTGGIGTYMFRLAGALGAAGHEVHVVAGPSDLAPTPQVNVTLHRVDANFDLKSRSRALRWLFWRTAAPLMAWMQPRVWHLLRWTLAAERGILEVDQKFGLDVIETAEFAGNAYTAGRLGRWPIHIRMHCPWELFVRINRMPYNPMHKLLDHFERLCVARYADAVTAPSEAMKREAEKDWKLRRPIEVIPNFMDVPMNAPALPDEQLPPRIVCIGRLEPLKGQDTLARAFALVADEHPTAELHLVGPDSWGGKQTFAELLTRIVPEAATRARIVLHGQSTLDQCEVHVKSATIAVVPSIGFESFSLTALEAMAAGRPIIVCRTGALPELIDHERTGLVTDAGNAFQMSKALDRLLSDGALRGRLASEAHADARLRFDSAVVLPRIMETYAGAMAHHRAHRRGR